MIAVEAKLMNPDVPQRIDNLMRACGNLREPFVDLGGHWQARVKRSMPDKPPLHAAAPGQPPAVHTSEYVHSMLYDAYPDGQALALGSSSVRARVLHEGGVIRARRAKALASPIAVESYGKRPRDFPDLDYIPPHDQEPEDRGVLGIGGAGGSFVALFALRRWVRIRAHPHIEMVDEDWDCFDRALNRRLEKEMKPGG